MTHGEQDAHETEEAHKDFPLFLHRTGQWSKKVRGRTRYFGVDPDAALTKWLEQKDALLAGREPKLRPSGCRVRDVVNAFLRSKKALVDNGELSPRTWRDYHQTCATLVEEFGRETPVEDLGGRDFERLRSVLAKTRKAVALGNEIQRVRSIFGFAFKDRLIPAPVNFGASFAKPSRKMVRKAKNEAGEKMLEAETLRSIIDGALVVGDSGPELVKPDATLRAMVLLGINCALGQADIASLPLVAVDFKRGWLNFPRVKTAIPRRCPLWPETVEALKVAIEERPELKTGDDAELVFLTRFGVPWVRLCDRGPDKSATPIDSIQQEWRKLLEAIDSVGLVRREGAESLAMTGTCSSVCSRLSAIDEREGVAVRARGQGPYYHRTLSERCSVNVGLTRFNQHDWPAHFAPSTICLASLSFPITPQGTHR